MWQASCFHWSEFEVVFLSALTHRNIGLNVILAEYDLKYFMSDVSFDNDSSIIILVLKLKHFFLAYFFTEFLSKISKLRIWVLQTKVSKKSTANTLWSCNEPFLNLHICDTICSSHLTALELLLSFPQVLFVVVQPVIDGFGQVGGDLGSGLMVACAVAAGMLTDVGRRLGDDEDLVNVLVVQLVVWIVVVWPVGELVLPGRHLLHFLVEQEVQLLLVGLRLLRGTAAGWRRLTALLEDTVNMPP